MSEEINLDIQSANQFYPEISSLYTFPTTTHFLPQKSQFQPNMSRDNSIQNSSQFQSKIPSQNV